MDKMWGGHEAPIREADAHRGELFRNGNYAMFIHWGLTEPSPWNHALPWGDVTINDNKLYLIQGMVIV